MADGSGSGLPFRSTAFRSLPEYERFARAMSPVLDERYRGELKLAEREENFFMEGVCGPDESRALFAVTFDDGQRLSDGRKMPNWRESVVCQRTGLNNRERAALHFALSRRALGRGDQVLVAGNGDVIPEWLTRRGIEVHRSPEGAATIDCLPGSISTLFAIEALSTIDVGAFLSQTARVLAPGGEIVISTPFHSAQTTTTVENGRNQVGWDILDRLKEAGLEKGEVHTYWAGELGYLGSSNFLICARRPL